MDIHGPKGPNGPVDPAEVGRKDVVRTSENSSADAAKFERELAGPSAADGAQVEVVQSLRMAFADVEASGADRTTAATHRVIDWAVADVTQELGLSSELGAELVAVVQAELEFDPVFTSRARDLLDQLS